MTVMMMMMVVMVMAMKEEGKGARKDGFMTYVSQGT